MYESHHTCHFFRLWGAKEGKKGINPDSPILGNMQNDFDSKFGDITGQSGIRYFIVEFKLSREGIAEEVNGAHKKIHRHHLYQHLRENKLCSALSRKGHFAGYADQNGWLTFEPYVNCVAPQMDRGSVLIEVLMKDQSSHELDHTGFVYNFDRFYEELNRTENDLSELSPKLLRTGLGLTKDQLEKYVQCMYQHLEQGTNSKGQAVLGLVDPSSKEFIAIISSFEELVEKLHKYFEELSNSISSYNSSNSSTFPQSP